MVFKKLDYLVYATKAAEPDESTAVNPLAINDQLMTTAEDIELVGRDSKLIFVEPVTCRAYHTNPTLRKGLS